MAADTDKPPESDNPASDWVPPRGPAEPETEEPSASSETNLSPEETPAEPPDAELAIEPESIPESDTAIDKEAEKTADNDADQSKEAPVIAEPETIRKDSRRSGKWLKGSKKKTTLLLAVIAAMVILGAGVAAYVGITAPKQPDRILQQAVANTFDKDKLSSVRFDGNLTLSGPNVPKLFGGADFSGESATNNDLSISASVNLGGTKATLDLRQLGGKDLYLRLSGLGDIGGLLPALTANDPKTALLAAQFAPILGQLDNQWFQFDASVLRQLTGGSSAALSTNSQLSNQDSRKLASQFQAHPFLKVKEQLKDATINGMDSYHVSLTLDKSELKKYLDGIKKANIASLQSSQTQLDQLKQNVDKIDFSKIPFEVWISKSQHFVDQFMLGYTDQKGTAAHIRVSLKDFNQVKSIQAPTGVQPFQNLLNIVLPALLSSGSGLSQ